MRRTERLLLEPAVGCKEVIKVIVVSGDGAQRLVSFFGGMRRVTALWHCGTRCVVLGLLILTLSTAGVVLADSARPAGQALEQTRKLTAPESVQVVIDPVLPSQRVKPSSSDHFGDGDVGDVMWDMEAKPPPPHRLRDRTLWGYSKRVVPTGPNPLHN